MATLMPDTGTTFPVAWQSVDDAGITYSFDPMHFPFPGSPLFESTAGPAFAVGFTTASREYKSPIQEMKVCYQNHYRYESLVMALPHSDEEARQIGEAAEAAMKPELGRLLERWHGEHLPAVLAHLHRLKSMQVENRPAEEIVALLDEADAIHRNLWTIHFRIAFPMLHAMQLFDELHKDLFGEDDADAHALLVGANSKSVMVGITLSDLAGTARELGLEKVFEETPEKALASALRATDNGREFLESLQTFLDVFGLRQDLFEYETPTWREDPSIALSNVRNYLRSGHDARAMQIAMAQGAERAVASAREKLAVYPQAVREQFEAMLQFARHGAFMQEEHNFYIDQQGTASLRLFYLQVGQYLKDLYVLEATEDIFMLTIDEVREAVAMSGASQANGRIRALVSQRRAEMDIARQLAPPPFLGEPPKGPPPGDNPFQRTMIKFFGGPPQQSEHANQLKGNPGSRGIATGLARVARTLDEASHLQPGEILVATTTMPAWTPLFGVAAGVVTETGGSLSHCAIVAREYGIPAVVGAHGATHRITTGQVITVDGSSGVVTLG